MHEITEHHFSACSHFSQSRIMRPRIHAAARRRDRRQILLGACCMKTAPNVPNKGARRGAKCASAAHEGGAPLGFQPVHTPAQTRRSSCGVGDIPDTASSPRRHRHRGAQASSPLIQPPVRYRPLARFEIFDSLQCSTVLLYDLDRSRYTVYRTAVYSRTY